MIAPEQARTVSLLGLAALSIAALARGFTHERVCAERQAEIREDLRRGDARMRRIEVMMQGALATLITLLLAVLGFMLTHSYKPPFL